MFLEIISPDKKIFSGEVTSVTLPGTDGSLGILANHAPIITTLQKGTIKIVEASNASQSFDVKGGVAEVQNNKIIVLAD
ncbi:MAG: ATP synthase F1 subunit epsilon [Bacteroidota bacterium]